MKTICICFHCGEQTFYAIEPKTCPQYCSFCKKKENRDNMVKENEEIKLARAVRPQNEKVATS